VSLVAATSDGTARGGTAAGGNGQAARSERTRQKLLATAERLFAERGIEAVSLREIATAARQRNPYVVQYHFGSKEALVGALLEVGRAPVNATRAEMLAAIDAAGITDREALVRAAMEALVRPLAQSLERPPSYLLRLIYQVYSSGLGAPSPALSALRGPRLPLSSDDASADTGVAAVNLLARGVRGAEARALGMRVGLALTLMMVALAGREALEQSTPDLGDREEFVQELVGAMAAIILRPPDSRARTATSTRRRTSSRGS